MNRGTPEYIEAVQRVKIAFFTEHLGMDIKGIVHVGANDGYEMHHYKLMGIKNLVGVEPLPDAIRRFRLVLPDIYLIECALSDHDGFEMLTAVTRADGTLGDGMNSSFLEEVKPHPDYLYDTKVRVRVYRWDTILNSDHFINPADYNCLVMDVQGYELPALRGFGESIRDFTMLNIECSRLPIYVGGVPASEVEAYLNTMGFERRSPIEEHDDVFFTARA